MRIRAGLAGVAALWLPLAVALAQTETEPTDDTTGQQKIEAQEQRLLILERKLELQDQAAKTAASSSAVVKAAGGKFSFQTPDGSNVIKFRGLLHFDGRRFNDDITPETAD